jgi:hypothetical protein
MVQHLPHDALPGDWKAQVSPANLKKKNGKLVQNIRCRNIKAQTTAVLGTFMCLQNVGDYKCGKTRQY